MDWLTALILGIIQGLTEFLPVSSSGHLELGKAILGVEAKESMTFTVIVHGATVLSTITVFRKELWGLSKGVLVFQWNSETRYMVKIIISMIPVVLLGMFFKEEIEKFFTGDVLFVSLMLIITALFLASTTLVKNGVRTIPYLHAFIIGIAQAVAVLPGISRSGATISAGLLLGNKKTEITKFSFLMVLVPIIAANLLEILSSDLRVDTQIEVAPLLIGFIAAFVSGVFACRWMIDIIRKGKLIYFAIYCFIIGLIGIISMI
ncbi:MAG: undecaprenyl-diphosphate phosphatase [Bacteroidales bacterium]|nr:undecaprenyl-diphosphate phosphatase [Bacteroidales bacterium]